MEDKNLFYLDPPYYLCELLTSYGGQEQKSNGGISGADDLLTSYGGQERCSGIISPPRFGLLTSYGGQEPDRGQHGVDHAVTSNLLWRTRTIGSKIWQISSAGF